MLRVLTSISTVLLIAYPVLAYFALMHWGPRQAAIAFLLCLSPAAVIRLAAPSPGRSPALGWLPLITIALLALSALWNHGAFMRAIPGLSNFLFLATFAATLHWGPPMIERFARKIHPDLDEARVRWCRQWTKIWCLFFLANGAVAFALAGWAPLSWWAIYNGQISYALVGLLVATEWILRSLRFAPIEKPEDPSHENA